MAYRKAKTMPYLEAKTLIAALDAVGCDWVASASGKVRTMDDRETHTAENWDVIEFYTRGVVFNLDGNIVRAQPSFTAKIRVEVLGWCV